MGAFTQARESTLVSRSSGLDLGLFFAGRAKNLDKITGAVKSVRCEPTLIIYTNKIHDTQFVTS